ncbi:hypothetical protein FJY70_02930 [candidate division WOR-3 bacterium]|nr:hypothetical protein [candidate division WOR-3 bacterium]
MSNSLWPSEPPVAVLSSTSGLASIWQLMGSTSNEIASVNETTSDTEEVRVLAPSDKFQPLE